MDEEAGLTRQILDFLTSIILFATVLELFLYLGARSKLGSMLKNRGSYTQQQLEAVDAKYRQWADTLEFGRPLTDDQRIILQSADSRDKPLIRWMLIGRLIDGSGQMTELWILERLLWCLGHLLIACVLIAIIFTSIGLFKNAPGWIGVLDAAAVLSVKLVVPTAVLTTLSLIPMYCRKIYLTKYTG